MYVYSYNSYSLLYNSVNIIYKAKKLATYLCYIYVAINVSSYIATYEKYK